MLTLRQIKSFVAVYEEKSFTAAATREGATQSGISQHIRQLESELKVQLFVRDGRNVEPTTAARLYYTQCIDVLRRLDMAQQSVASNRTLGAIRVGLMPTFTRAVLTPTLSRFLQESPGSEVKIVEAYSGVLTDMVLGGELDFAVVPSFEGATGLSHHLLARDREMLVRAGRGKRAALKPVRLAELGPLKVIVPSAQNTRRRNIESYFTANGVEVAQRLELDAMMGTLQFVAASDWVAILPFLMMAGDLEGGRFDIRPLEDQPFYSEFILIQPARKAMMPAASLFVEILKTETARAREIFNKRTSVRRPRSA